MPTLQQRTINMVLAIGICVFTLAACAPPVDWKKENARIAGECKAKGFKKRYDQVKCENTARQHLMESIGDNDSDYDTYLLKRLQIAAAQDAKRITAQEAELQEQQALLEYRRLVAAEQREQQEQHDRYMERLKQQQQYNQLLQTLQNQPQQKDNLNCHTRCDNDGLGSSCYTDCN